jgi:iron complex transport system ATP-binding protein
MSLKATDLDVRIGTATLLDGVSLEVADGELVALSGPNGAGKTTLMRSLAGDVKPARGSVSLDDQDLEDWSGADLARRRSVMSTDTSVAFGYNAREVALLGRLPIHAGDPSEADDAIVDDLLAAVDCSHLAGRVFSTLSTGERQRIQLARAIAQLASSAGTADDAPDTRYMLLDEPTSSLDPAHQHRAMRLLREQVEAGTGVLAVLHDLNLAAAYADRIALMKDTRIVATGTPSEVLRSELLREVFDVPMLVIPHPHLAHPLVVAEPADTESAPPSQP